MSIHWHGSIKCIPLAHGEFKFPLVKKAILESGMEGIVWVESVATLIPSHTVTHG